MSEIVEPERKVPGHYTDGILGYSGVIPSDFCEGLISLFEGNPDQQQEHKSDGYSFTRLNLTVNWTGIAGKLTDIFNAVIREYGIATGLFQFWPHHGLDPIMIKRYLPGRGDFFAPHVDAHDRKTCNRFLAMFAYLCDVEEGGETVFPYWGTSVRPTKGLVLAFPPWLPYVHEANPPISGPKYMVGTYATYL